MSINKSYLLYLLEIEIASLYFNLLWATRDLIDRVVKLAPLAEIDIIIGDSWQSTETISLEITAS